MPISDLRLSVDILRLSPMTNTQPSGTVCGPMKSSFGGGKLVYIILLQRDAVNINDAPVEVDIDLLPFGGDDPLDERALRVVLILLENDDVPAFGV